jgi:REP element-mobilizing transposase RayT
MLAFITPVPQYAGEYPQFFTASIKGWYKLLEHDPDSYRDKDIIINSLWFFVEDKRIKLYAFAIMSDHIHLPLIKRNRC